MLPEPVTEAVKELGNGFRSIKVLPLSKLADLIVAIP